LWLLACIEPEGEGAADGDSRHERRGGARMCRADYSLARMSGMLDLSRDEKAKHFLPRWLRDAPT